MQNKVSNATLSRWLKVKRLGIDTHQESIIYMRYDCVVCRAEGFEAHTRVNVSTVESSIIATVNVVTSDMISSGEVGFSEAAWKLLNVNEDDRVLVTHTKTLESLIYLREKIHGKKLSQKAFKVMIDDIVAGRYTDIHLSAFITACSGNNLSIHEINYLTDAMVKAGEKLSWPMRPIMDKHCVGGLPGNRTTPIVVAIVAAAGLIMPKTSSRAITSPAGTADTMETLTRVNLPLSKMREVVEKEGGCFVWGGSVSLSPADDILIRVERALDVDSEGQLVASVLSKKIAAGSTHLLVDIPIGLTAKISNREVANRVRKRLITVGKQLGIVVETLMTDGSQPVGRGIGPALEAKDVLAVLQQLPQAPHDLRQRALIIAGNLLKMANITSDGLAKAKEILESGAAWRKFQKICEAQGGLFEPKTATHQFEIVSKHLGKVTYINNRFIALLAKLAGAPLAQTAGIEMRVRLGDPVEKGQPLYVLHAETPGELAYALDFLAEHGNGIQVEEGI